MGSILLNLPKVSTGFSLTLPALRGSLGENRASPGSRVIMPYPAAYLWRLCWWSLSETSDSNTESQSFGDKGVTPGLAQAKGS